MFRSVFCTLNLGCVPSGRTIFLIHTEYKDLKKNKRKSLHLAAMQENRKQENDELLDKILTDELLDKLLGVFHRLDFLLLSHSRILINKLQLSNKRCLNI